MKSLDALSQRMDAVLNRSEEERRRHEAHMQLRMDEIARRPDQFNKAAAVLLATIIRSRMALLAGKFEGAQILDAQAGGGHGCKCVFDRNTRFPASTSLELAVIPMCGMPVNRNWAAANSEHGGKTY